jgi:hypothetical protein
MINRKKILALMLLVMITGLSLAIFRPHQSSAIETDKSVNLHSSGTIEGTENVILTEINRTVNISGYGLVNIEDRLTVLNKNSNPIDSIYVGIPLNYSSNLIYFLALGMQNNVLSIERSYTIMNDYEMIAIYFDSPLLPLQTKMIKITQTYMNLLQYTMNGPEQRINFTLDVFPLTPYRAEGTIRSSFVIPDSSTEISHDTIDGMGRALAGGIFLYDLSETSSIAYLDPFLQNIADESEISLIFSDNSITDMELEKIKRDITISPWGLITVKETHLIKNIGSIDIMTFSLFTWKDATNIRLYDDLGEILGTTIQDSDDPNKKEILINLLYNRAPLLPNSKLQYTLEYTIPFENHFSLNWFEASIQLNLATTGYEFLGKEQTIQIIIEGCGSITQISNPPNAIIHSSGALIIVYTSENVSPIQNNVIQFTFAIDYFELLLRPISIILIIACILSLFAIIIKSRKREADVSILKAEFIPVNEIREFCSLYEEKNALILEIRQSEEDAKRKKMAKKSYKNILDKNTAKIEQIKSEIEPFKKALIETGENFSNIVKKLDLLDAERISIEDGINLLENRYRRGKLPSRAAYQKLANDFLKRRKKIDRTIDKYIQQLRSYLL